MNQPLLIQPETDWKLPSLNNLPDWSKAKRVGMDIETRDPSLRQLGPGMGRKDSYPVGISFAIDDKAWYLPFNHAEGSNLDESKVRHYILDQMSTFTGEMVGMNLSYDLGWLYYRWGIPLDNATFRDIQIADTLIYELHSFYNMNAIAKRRNLPQKAEDELRDAAKLYGVDPKSGLWQLPATQVGKYAEQDALLPLRIYEDQLQDITNKKLSNVFDIESKVLPILVKMSARGVKIDTDKLAYIEDWSHKEEQKALDALNSKHSYKFTSDDLYTADAFKSLYEKINIPLETTASGQVRTDSEFLQKHNLGELVRAKKVNKLRTTFAESMRRFMIKGRLHPRYNQLARDKEFSKGRAGTISGRLSAEKPNVQQQPSRDEFAKMWRSIYLPDEDALWACLDYSQQEPRLFTHYAEVTNLSKATEAADAYRDNPNNDNHQMMAEMTGLPRKMAKQVYLGISYGMGGAKFCRQVGLPTGWMFFHKKKVNYFNTFDEAMAAAKGKNVDLKESAGLEGRRILNTFNEKLPYVKTLARKCTDIASKRGYIKTFSGRRCHFPESAQGGFAFGYKAINRLIQGSAADQTKIAMIEVDNAGYDIQLQVHDELDLSVKDRNEARQIADVMEHCVQLNVPSKVDVELGPNWGEIE